jgi:hypothetical protein
VDNIWALQFGHDAFPNNGAHNQLFFTAGADSYANGLFGVITVGPWSAAIQVAQADEF